MDFSNSILKDIRDSLDLDPDGTEFQTDILMNINAALSTLNQAGVGLPIIVSDETLTWQDFMDVNAEHGNNSFPIVPLYVKLYSKMIFDPPPPSAVETFNTRISEMLWRLKIAYELGGFPK